MGLGNGAPREDGARKLMGTCRESVIQTGRWDLWAGGC